jgi:para-aminobenzoate synthetase component 1
MPPEISLPLEQPCPVTDAITAWRAIADLPYPFLLHSSLPGTRARWSFFGADPFSIYRGGDYFGGVAAFRRLARRAGAIGSASGGAQGAAAHAEYGTLAAHGALRAPFTGGAVGYWSYDFGRRLEHWRIESGARVAEDDLELPDFLLGFYDVVGAIDHHAGEAWLYSSGLPLDGERRIEHARRRLERFTWLLERATSPERDEPAWRDDAAGGSGEPLLAHSNFHPDDYRGAVARIQEHIRRGDIFQANLSQRWTVPLESRDPERTALALHEAMTQLSPAPFAALLGGEDHAVVSASPERFLELRGARVEARPIKGTRTRHADEEADARLATELAASAKDRAENVMIVDVLRNDLGRVCESGSVAVPELCALESFPQVHHLTSTVTGTLAEGRDAFDLLHACFPGGSITGAPKIRAMELLEGIEPHRRHLYTGSIGYLDWHGSADWSIAIRTALVTPDAIRFAAGGGITADSDPQAEYEETLHKAEGLRLALAAMLGGLELDAPAVHAG